MGTDNVAVTDFHVKLSGRKIFYEPGGVFVRRLRQCANSLSVVTGLLLQLVAPLFQANNPHLQVLDLGDLLRDRIVK